MDGVADGEGDHEYGAKDRTGSGVRKLVERDEITVTRPSLLSLHHETHRVRVTSPGPKW